MSGTSNPSKEPDVSEREENQPNARVSGKGPAATPPVSETSGCITEAVQRTNRVLVALVRDAEEHFLQIMEPEEDVRLWLTRLEVASRSDWTFRSMSEASNQESEPE